jgi:hypothetical protein
MMCNKTSKIFLLFRNGSNEETIWLCVKLHEEYGMGQRVSWYIAHCSFTETINMITDELII